jgi:hypothetical protein
MSGAACHAESALNTVPKARNEHRTEGAQRTPCRRHAMNVVPQAR